MPLELVNVDTPPSLTLSKCHYFCDYIELVALYGSDDIISCEDIYDRFYDSGVINEEQEGVPSEGWIGSDEASMYIQRWRDRISSWFRILSSRQQNYGDVYPFLIDGDTISLKDSLSGKSKLYLGLLLASMNSYHNKTPLFTSVFEEISKLSLRSYLGSNSVVHRFGVSQLSGGRYSGSLRDKMRRLACDIEHQLTNLTHVFREGDNGDGGVDIVAWLPFFGDPNKSRKQLFFGQSATGKKWSSKQGSVVRVKNYINIPDNAQNVLFVPFDLRDIERRFEEEGDITASLVFDRFRILSLVDEADIWEAEKGLEFQAAINEAIELEEDLV